MSLSERQVVTAFVARLAKLGNPELRVDCFPEDEPNEKARIDAVAGHFAIEHTSIDTASGQRQASAQFMKVVGTLEDDFRDRIAFFLRILVPWEAVSVGKDWSQMNAVIGEWVHGEDAEALPTDSLQTIQMPGLPFSVRIMKSVTGRGGVSFSREEPNADDLPSR